MQLGLYLFDVPTALDSVCLWEKRLKRPVDIVSLYQAWDSTYRKFCAEKLREIHQSGRTALITWEPWKLPRAGKAKQDQPSFTLRRILGGDYDHYISSWAQQSKSAGIPYLLRPMHEMNGNWYPWCGSVNQNQPQDYIEVWRYLHGLFHELGATQISWVWSPYAESFPPARDNVLSRYYPGDDYVDWVALDGYNWGTSMPWSRWQTFQEIFSSAYESITQITNKPLLIAETACAENGGSKSQWIRSGLETLGESFPRIAGLVWFNVRKECDWRIDSSRASLRAFRQTVQNWRKTQGSLMREAGE